MTLEVKGTKILLMYFEARIINDEKCNYDKQ